MKTFYGDWRKLARFLEKKTGKPFRPTPASPGTRAYEYISGLRNISSLQNDPDLLVAIDDKQPDGSLIYLFRDYSSLAQKPNKN